MRVVWIYLLRGVCAPLLVMYYLWSVAGSASTGFAVHEFSSLVGSPPWLAGACPLASRRTAAALREAPPVVGAVGEPRATSRGAGRNIPFAAQALFRRACIHVVALSDYGADLECVCSTPALSATGLGPRRGARRRSRPPKTVDVQTSSNRRWTATIPPSSRPPPTPPTPSAHQPVVPTARRAPPPRCRRPPRKHAHPRQVLRAHVARPQLPRRQQADATSTPPARRACRAAAMAAGCRPKRWWRRRRRGGGTRRRR